MIYFVRNYFIDIAFNRIYYTFKRFLILFLCSCISIVIYSYQNSTE